MPEFSTNEAVSLEKQVNLKAKLCETKPEDILGVYEINRCVEWIKSNGYEKVCLQFPDNLLPDSSEVALKLQSILKQPVYILGDTAYENCCIDYISAAHINADAIIHFGPICFSKTSANIPYLNIYEKHQINVCEVKSALSVFEERDAPIIFLLDTPYIHIIDEIINDLKEFKNVKVQKIDVDSFEINNEILIFLGNNYRKLLNIYLSYSSNKLYFLDFTNKNPKILEYVVESRVLKRRNFLMEKIKDSKNVGIIIGTLGVKNYLNMINRIKKLVELSGKKYYLISVGKPTVAKLANFAEIDVYVIITCSMNEIYDSRDYYKPIVTPYDVEIALNPSRKDSLNFCYDYNAFLDKCSELDVEEIGRSADADVSLLTGQIRSHKLENVDGVAENVENQVALRTDGTVALNSNFGAGYLAERSWKGLEQDLGQSKASAVQEGRSGIASGYENETH